MPFYDFDKDKRQVLVQQMQASIKTGSTKKDLQKIAVFFEGKDTYIRKSAYCCIGKIYKNEALVRKNILLALDPLSVHLDYHIR